jgi:hypothetical protein
MRTLVLLSFLALAACALPQRLADERRAVYAEEARFDSLNAVPPDQLTEAERAERDSLAGAAFERQEHLADVDARADRHKRTAVVLTLGGVAAAGVVTTFVVLSGSDEE